MPPLIDPAVMSVRVERPGMTTRRHLLALAVGAGAVSGCLDLGAGGPDSGEATTTGGSVGGAGMALSSPAFEDGGTVPTRFTCDGANESPPLRVEGVPEEAESLALVVDDPDAPGSRPFVHWLVWNLPPERTSVPAAVPRGGTVSSLGGARQGETSAGTVGYTGPCPPRGDGPHRYRFVLHALSTSLSVTAGADRSTLDAAMADVVVARTRLTGRYSRE